jgi:hypothetical protein
MPTMQASSGLDEAPPPATLHITKVGPHTLEILTDEQWARLGPEDQPKTFSRYGPNICFRLYAQSPNLNDDEDVELPTPGEDID